jgi:hypothetical protein
MPLSKVFRLVTRKHCAEWRWRAEASVGEPNELFPTLPRYYPIG